MIELSVYFSAFGLGLLGGAHCMGMCGGIMAALSFAMPSLSSRQRWLVLLSYNSGRILSYVFIAVIASLFVKKLGAGQGVWLIRTLAGALLILMGLYLADWWRGLSYLERAGSYLWRYIQPLGKRFMPVKNVYQAFALGTIWGWLPCGLIYSALAYATAESVGHTQPSLQAAMIMLAFGLGTLPAVLAGGWFSQTLKHWLQKRKIRLGFALLIIVFGLWTIVGALQHSGQHVHQHSGHSQDFQTLRSLIIYPLDVNAHLAVGREY